MEELSRNCNLTGVILNQVDMQKHLKYHPTHIEAARAPTMIGTDA
jgi:hypothetical protein